MEKTKSETFHTYKAVEKLERGDTVINLGIVKAIFVSPANKTVKLTFNPSRSIVMHNHGYYYNYGDKLMVA